MSVVIAKKKIEDRAKEIWRDLLNTPAGEGLGGVRTRSSDELWAMAYEMSKKENPTENAEIAADAAGKEESDKFTDFISKVKNDDGSTKGFIVKEDEGQLQDIYYEQNGALVKGKSATADILTEARTKQNLPAQGYAGENYTFTNPLTGKVEQHTWDGTSWKPINVDGNNVNVNALAVFDSKGNNAAIKLGYEGNMASRTLYGGGEASKEYDPATFTENKGMGAGGIGGFGQENGTPPPPTGGGFTPPTGTAPTGGGTTTATGTPKGIDPNLTRDSSARPTFADSWRNMQQGNRPTSAFTGIGQATQVSPYDTGGMFDMTTPENYITPYGYTNLLKQANLQGISPTFRAPFENYLDRANLSYGLMNPIRSAELGTGGFAEYIAGQPQLASGQDMWNQVQNIMGGFSDLNPVAQAQLGAQFGIGATDEGAKQRRQMLASQLQSYDVNPLLRKAYSDILARDYAQASLQNQMYRDNPLAYALEQRTGFVAPQLQQTGFTDALQLPVNKPEFDLAGNIRKPFDELTTPSTGMAGGMAY